ncbi:GTP-binding protein REM 1-like [Limulus polyphemus]|uniref:GTP-binding protein REM 1-like n=1 Tax=Limulus polyphemus TaxID=6850 RepID=A0ABM1B4E8_LIMPO|nr:GTP-binding protein REM 1-like [Limulus polyphemus]
MSYSRIASTSLSNSQVVTSFEVKKKELRERKIQPRRKTAPIVMFSAAVALEDRESPSRAGDDLGSIRTTRGSSFRRSRVRSTKESVHRTQSMRTSSRPHSLDPANRSRQRVASVPRDNITKRSSSTHSLPLAGEEGDYQRLRNFSITPKGLINRGDSFRSKSHSSQSVSSSGSQLPTAETSGEAHEVPSHSTVRYRVVVLGCPEVGKSCLITQFTTSEYICAYDASSDEQDDKLVTVVLNREESELLFVEYTLSTKPDSSQPVETIMDNADAFVVVYSSCDKTSFRRARDTLLRMSNTKEKSSKAIILVGNKTDLARLRVVNTKDGKALATSIGCKFIETSAGINHNVDELLVGIVSQIRLKDQRLERDRESVTLATPALGTPCKAKVLIRKLLEKTVIKSKSCNNLHVL